MKSFKSHNIYHCGDCGALWGYTPTRKTAQFPVENGCCGAVGLIRTFSYIEKIFFRFRISENKIVYIWGKTAPQPHTPITACFLTHFAPTSSPTPLQNHPTFKAIPFQTRPERRFHLRYPDAAASQHIRY